MRYGICTDIENLELVQELGYDYIELSVTKTMGLSEDVLRTWRGKLEASGIRPECWNILFPKTMNLVDGSVSEEALREYLERAMAFISGFGGELVVFGSGKCRTCPPEIPFKEAWKRLVEVYRITGEIGKKYGVHVVIEPLSRKETNMVCTMAEGAMLQAQVDHDNVGLLSDYFHVCANQDKVEDITMIKAFGHIHIASGNGRRYPLPGDNENYADLFKALKAIGYQGRMSIEGKTEDIRTDGKAALALLKELEEQG